jgi:amino acid adenylation domain-containing protein
VQSVRSAAEGQTVLRESPLAERDLVSVFREVAENHADRVALTVTDRELTYRELDTWSTNVAMLLHGYGVTGGSRVALRVTPSAEAVVAILGILKCGASYVPLDIRNPPSRNAFILGDSGCSAVIGDRVAEFADIVTITAEDIAASRSVDDPPRLSSPPAAQDKAYLIYTSGTTGNPKGVGISHGNVTALLAAGSAVFDFSCDDRWLLFHSLAFDFSVWEMWGAFSRGGTLVVLEHWDARTPEQCLRLIENQRVTVLNQTPTAFAPFSESVLGRSGCELPDLRYVIFGGEKLTAATVRPWAQRFGLHRPQLVNGYGITETTVFTTFHTIEEADLARSESIIGAPLPGFTARVVDDEGRDVAGGGVGELWLAGPQVAEGYLDRPDLTAAKFPPASDPHTGASTRYYRSGDLVNAMPNGELCYHGRADLQVKVRGYRIELSDIEAAVRGHGSVVDAVVSPREFGPGDVRLVCTYAAREGREVPARELRKHVRGLLPSYMWPAHYRRISQLPLTINGKIDRAKVAQSWDQGDE